MTTRPDIDLRHVPLPGTDRVYYQPFCHACGWEDEPYPIREAALIEAGIHLKVSCLADSGGGDAADSVSGGPAA